MQQASLDSSGSSNVGGSGGSSRGSSPSPSAGKNDKDESLAKRIREYTAGEEVASALTHGIGALFGIVGLVLLIIFSVEAQDGWKLAASIIYGISIILEMTASTLYHALQKPKAKYVFKIIDHVSIYILIAGTYTPFCLITLRDSGGIPLAIIVWTLALVGIASEAFWVFRPRWLSAVIYLLMGWLIVFKIGALSAALTQPGVYLLLAGGIAYTIGTIFYILKKVKYMHSIWHLWVLAGVVLHYFAVLLYVIR